VRPIGPAPPLEPRAPGEPATTSQSQPPKPTDGAGRRGDGTAVPILTAGTSVDRRNGSVGAKVESERHGPDGSRGRDAGGVEVPWCDSERPSLVCEALRALPTEGAVP
jgi:hypothetical protein